MESNVSGRCSLFSLVPGGGDGGVEPGVGRVGQWLAYGAVEGRRCVLVEYWAGSHWLGGGRHQCYTAGLFSVIYKFSPG